MRDAGKRNLLRVTHTHHGLYAIIPVFHLIALIGKKLTPLSILVQTINQLPVAGYRERHR
jgi:hypothetical protein